MLKKILDFLRKIGLLHSGSATWKGKGTGDYNTAEYGKHEKHESSDEHEE
ncbi:hypothetical protein ACFL3T_02325 [Patescibacteria group bacterium]